MGTFSFVIVFNSARQKKRLTGATGPKSCSTSNVANFFLADAMQTFNNAAKSSCYDYISSEECLENVEQKTVIATI